MNLQELIWPNFFIVGTQRSGTTSLWAHLRKHPQVFLPEVKEPGYFASSLGPVPPRQAKRFSHGDLCPDDLIRYQSLYKGALQRVAIGDASAYYLWEADAAAKIRKVSPDARIIIMLRDPVDRAYSHYLLSTMQGDEHRPFLRALREDYAHKQKGWWTSQLYVDQGLYYSQVRRYLETFGKEQVAIFLFDDLKRNPVELFTKVALHLGIEPQFQNESELSQAENAFKMPRYPLLHGIMYSVLNRKLRKRIFPSSLNAWLNRNKFFYNTERPAADTESRKFLQEIFAPDLVLLEELLGRKLPELRRSWV